MQVLVLNGVNLDMLGRRDPALYGGVSARTSSRRRSTRGRTSSTISARCRQTNSEGEYIDWIHDAYGDVDGVIVNPGAWTHYSYAIHDALEILEVPIVEVHLSNIDEREEWRRHSRRRRARRAPRDRQGPRRLPRGARVPRRDGAAMSARLDALARAARAAAARHEPRQHPLPDRLRQLERRAARRPERRGEALHRLPLHRGRRRRSRASRSCWRSAR